MQRQGLPGVLLPRAAKWGHTARECPKGKGKERVWGGDWDKGGDRKGNGEGASAWPWTCFQCGSLDHIMKDCPIVKVQAVEGSEEPEVLFIDRVDNWVNVPRSNRDPTVSRQKVGFQHRGNDWDHVEPPPGLLTNRFKV